MIDLIENMGGVGREINGPGFYTVVQKWRETFSASVLEDTGKWTIEGIDWHTFSYGCHPYKKGEIAKEQFQNHRFEKMYLWSSSPNFSDSAFLVRPREAGFRKDLVNFLASHGEYLDLYLCAEDFSWTCVLTHEEEFETIYADVK